MLTAMLEYMTITPAPRASLPPELALLVAQVELAPPKPNPQPAPAWPRHDPPADDLPLPAQRVGHVAGVVIDNSRRVSHYLIRLAIDEQLVLVPVFAARVRNEQGTPVVELPWTETQLDAQPRLPDKTTLPDEFEEHPVIFWEGPTPVPPGGQVEPGAGVKEAVVAGGASAAVGAVIGTIVGGPIVGAGLALFFGLGGGIAGGMTGAAREDAADAKWLYKDGDVAGELGQLELRLRDASLYERGTLRARRMVLRVPPRDETARAGTASAHH